MSWTPQQFLDYELRQRRESQVRREILTKVERELSLHDDIIRYCQSQWPPWKFIRARPDQRSTIAKGAHDFTIFLPNRILCIECKRSDGKPDADQQVWAKELEMLGHRVHVVRSMEEFLALTK